MSESDIIAVIEQSPVDIKLSSGPYKIHPLTVRRLAKMAAMLKDVQGDPAKFKDMGSPDFHRGVADMLVAAGDHMPKALVLLTGDNAMEKLEDMSLLDLSAVILAAAQVNKPALLKESFLRAVKVFSGTDPK